MGLTDDVPMISCAGVDVKVKIDNFHIIKEWSKDGILFTNKTNAVDIVD